MHSDWTLEDPGYDESKFYTRATDKRGFSQDFHFRVAPDWLRIMEEVFDSKVFPYKTKSDIVRDALFHRLHWLRQQMLSGKQDEVAVLESTANEARAYMDDLDRVEQVVQSVEAAARRIALIDPDEAHRLINSALERVPRRQLLRKFFTRRMREAFPQWIAPPGAEDDDDG